MKWLNISNSLSLLRIIFVIPIVLLLLNGLNTTAFIVSLIAMSTDFFDGYFARKLKQESELGKILDPLADKILIGAIVLTLFFMSDFPLWLACLVVGRDLLILTGGLILSKKIKNVTPSNIYGKITMLILSITIFIYILNLAELKEIFNFLSLIFISI
ncbi:MAG: CDP-alcohol phosphatidyltransferase family protein, partial [Ignavibacteria bacterium]|nr:CDP-alcohol phosphatidyltransferase family protein [Ignavibacteria bacterium]